MKLSLQLSFPSGYDTINSRINLSENRRCDRVRNFSENFSKSLLHFGQPQQVYVMKALTTNTLKTNKRGGPMTDNEYRKMYDKDPRKAQTALFDEYLGYVYAIVYNKLRSCGSSEDIEECVGDVFSAVLISYDRSGSFDGDLKGLIGTIANRTAIQMYRKLVRHSDTVYIETETTELADTENVEENAERSVLKNTLLKLINSLGQPDSDIIIQKFYYNMNSKEIADKHSMSPASVRMRCSRALKKLKELLANEGYEMKEGNI